MKKYWIPIVVFFIFLSALFIRIQYIKTTIIPRPIVADAKQYVLYGYNLITHGTYSKDDTDNPTPDSFRSPGYPFFIATAYFIGGKRSYYSLVIFMQVILSSLLVLLTYYIASFFMRSFYAVLTAVLVALDPHLVSISSYILTETFFGFFLLSSLSCFILALQKRKTILFILSALLFGYTYLINQTALFLPFIFITAAISMTRIKSKICSEKNLLFKLTIFLLIFALFPFGWAVRNYISLTPESSTGTSRLISTLSQGTYPDFIYKSPKFKYFPYKEDPMQPEFGSSFKSLKKILWSRIKKDPVRYITWYVFKKPYWLWSWNILQGQGDIYIYPVIKSLYMSSYLANMSRVIIKVLYPLCLILALVGLLLLFIFKGKKDNKETIIDFHVFPFIICIYFTAIYTIAAPWPRYTIPLRPELYLCSIWSLQILREKFIKNIYSNYSLKV